RRERCPPWRPSASAPAQSHRNCEHQLSDAMHDEGSLRAMPAEAHRSSDRKGNHHLFLSESGPADGSRGLQKPEHASSAEHSAGKAEWFVVGLFAEASGIVRTP